MAIVTVDPGPVISYRIDGVSATSDIGHALTSYGKIELYGTQQISDFSITSVSSATATSVTVSYLR